MTELRVANWNVEWRKPASRDAAIIRERLAAFRPDIVCLTEAWSGFLAEWGGYELVSRPRPDKEEGQRSVVLWSREPWRNVDDLGHADLPRQSFVKGTTATPVGDLVMAGIIIPYHLADVAHGSRDRKMWEQHERFLDALPSAISDLPERAIVAGDFNQRLPSEWVPERLSAKLEEVLRGFEIVTRSAEGPGGAAPIDHIAAGAGLTANEVATISHLYDERPGRVSDHFAVAATFGAGNGEQF